MAIGFCPFTRNALKHHKVRHKLGDGGASEAMEKELAALSKRYRRLKLSVSAQGLNGNAFIAKLPVRRKHPLLQKTEDEQVAQLIKNEGAFSAGAQWCTFVFQLLGFEGAGQSTSAASEGREKGHGGCQNQEDRGRVGKDSEGAGSAESLDRHRETVGDPMEGHP